jgi:hypothetical protein
MKFKFRLYCSYCAIWFALFTSGCNDDEPSQTESDLPLIDRGYPDAESSSDSFHIPGDLSDWTAHDAFQDYLPPDAGDLFGSDFSGDDPATMPGDLTGFIGSSCITDSDCPYAGGYCIAEDAGYPNGMCSQDCDLYCPDMDGHPTTFCIESPPSELPQCHSRCDYLFYPGVGCREEYICVDTPRFGEPETVLGTCIPDDGTGPTPLGDCMDWLVDYGVPFEPTTYTPRSPEGYPDLLCTVEDPVELYSPINGINFRYYYDDPGDFDPMVISCELARSITLMTEILLEYKITEVVHVGTTVCRIISGTTTISQHGMGQAIDLSGFIDESDTWFGIYDHWEHDTDTPATEEGQTLYDIAHRLHDDWIFNVVLTPEYNSAHDNHFHVDMTEGAHFLGYHDLFYGPYLGINTTGD